MVDPYAPPPEHTDWHYVDHVPIENACIECGKEAGIHCGCCGFPLCGMHHELGAGFCRKYHHVGGVSVCIYRSDVYVGTRPREETVLTTRGPTDHYHLPDEADAAAPACSPDPVGLVVSVTLAEARDRDLDLCQLCELEARHRYALFQEELREEWGDRDAE